jgi:hypothetical protein
MKRTKQSTFAKRERSEKSTGFAPVGGEDMTHTAKHTPGPWVLSEGNECIYVRSNVHPNAIAAVEYDFNSDIDDTTEEAQANAHLISAAPAMYTAIQHLLEWAKGNRGSKTGNPYCIPEVRHALKTLASIQGVKDYLDADTTVEGGPMTPSQNVRKGAK